LLTRRSATRGQAALLLIALITIAAVPAGAGLIGIAGNNVLYDINIANGATSNPRPVGNKIDMIAYSPSGTLYGVSQGFPTDVPAGGQLYTIDPTTGAATLVATMDTYVVTEGDIAFDPTSGILYAVDGAGQLFTINTITGAGTVIGTVGSNIDLSAMAFDAAGNLYMVESFGQSLLKVNKTTAAVIATLPMGNVEQQVGGLAFVPANGTLFYAGGIPSKFYSVNTTIGTGMFIGAMPPTDGIWGLTLIPDPTPAHDTTWGRLKTLYR
jgi:DNA-binding beta-propeller fold protein YncE